MVSSSVDDYFSRLLEARQAPRGAWPLTVAPETLGLITRDSAVIVPPEVELLGQTTILDLVQPGTAAWLNALRVFPVIDSTNSALLERLGSASVDGVVYLAECQIAGRGRRGRVWHSPLGRNLAVSIGFDIERAPSDLGGLSLVVGLAVVDLLQGLGVARARVKWPNDVLVDGRKLAGVLVELAADRDRVSVVVGVGVNLELPEHLRADIDQAVTDLGDYLVLPGRNRLAAALIDHIRDYVLRFAEIGFEPMRETWLAHHVLQGGAVTVHDARGDFPAVAVGVTGSGELLVEADGRVRALTGGEVSVRAGDGR